MHCGFSQGIEYSSLGGTVGSCCLSALCVIASVSCCLHLRLIVPQEGNAEIESGSPETGQCLRTLWVRVCSCVHKRDHTYPREAWREVQQRECCPLQTLARKYKEQTPHLMYGLPLSRGFVCLVFIHPSTHFPCIPPSTHSTKNCWITVLCQTLCSVSYVGLFSSSQEPHKVRHLVFSAQ